MALLVPFDRAELCLDFFALLVVDADDVVFACCGEGAAVGGVVHCHYVVTLFKSVPDLFARFGRELIEMTTGASNQQDWSGAATVFAQRPPPQSIDRTLLSNASVDLSYLVISSQIENPDVTIRIAASSHRVLLVESGHHEFMLAWDDSLHENFVFEWDFLDYSG